MSKRLRVAVIGAGSMGRNHARIYGEMEDLELVAIADPSPEALGRLTLRHNVATYTDYRAMLKNEQLDLLSIVVPTEQHFAVAQDVLRAGVPLLVEKPIAATVAEGAALVALAKELDVLLTVGHIERFNPAIIALKQQLDRGALGKIYQIGARRIGPFPSRITDVGVVVDLATHDLDIMHYLTNSQVTRLHAEIGQRLHTAHEDLLLAVLRFENDIVGVLEINWLTPTKVRELSVIGERGMFVANYLTQDLFFYENDAVPHGQEWHEAAVMGVTEGRMIRFKVNKKEPLRAELEAFAAAVRNRQAAPVSGMDGLLALSVAQALTEAGAARADLLFEMPTSFRRLEHTPA
jgi:UDP-N-acetylglucosamine 3-dehydrogenase